MPRAAALKSAIVAVVGLDDLADDRAEHRPDVDPHVKNAVRAILELASDRVEIPNHRRNVGFEEAVADDETGEAPYTAPIEWTAKRLCPAMKKRAPTITVRR